MRPVWDPVLAKYLRLAGPRQMSMEFLRALWHMDASNRLDGLLRREGIYCLEDLQDFTFKEFCGLRGNGTRSLRPLCQFMHQRNLEFRDGPPPEWTWSDKPNGREREE